VVGKGRVLEEMTEAPEIEAQVIETPVIEI
jgi:hypothetical protein